MTTVELKLDEVMAKKKVRTIAELHRKTGLSKKAISKAFNNKNKRMDLDTIARLCKALNCEIGDLLVLKK